MALNDQDNEPFTQPELVRIAKRFPDKWEMIASTTGKFEDYEIDNIKRNNNYHDDTEKACQMLNKYKNKLGSRKCLVEALKEHGKNELAGYVQSKLLQVSDDPKNLEDVRKKMEDLSLPDGPSPNGASGNGESEQVATVFISYQWDIQEVVLKLKDELESNNLTCWMDVKNTEGGDDLAKEIVEGIRGCKVFVACVTKKYTKSSYCRKEVTLAAELKKKIVPLLFEKPWPVEGPMALHFTELIYVKCEKGLTKEKLSEIVENIKSKAQ